MKKNIYILGLAVLSLCAACEDNDSPLEMNDFSDISFINSQTVNQYSTNVIEVGNPISFMDMSQNTVSHSWTIDEGCRFIRGEYTREDTVFTQFIIPEATRVSEENIVYVLFNEPGDKQVRLYNTYNDSVSYHGLSDAAVIQQRFPGDANHESYFDKEEGVWVFDTLMTFKVLDKVNARIHAYQEGAVILDIPKEETPALADTLSWPTVTLGVGDTLTLALDTYGEPDEIEWALTGALAATNEANDSEVLQASPKVSRLSQEFIATKMGTFRAGKVIVIRTDGTSATQTTELQPAGKIVKYIPMFVEVTAPSTPLLASNMKITDATSLTFSFSGEIPSLPDNVASEFSLQVENTDKGLAATTINITDVTLDNSTSTITLTLESPVYSDDTIQLIYTGEDIVDIYGRSLEQIDAAITDYYSAVISDPVKRGFEGAIKNNKAIDGWFIYSVPLF